MPTLLKVLPRFLSNEALYIVERIAKITNNPLDLLRKLHDVYAMKPKNYRTIHLITAASSNDDEKHTMHATIREIYSEATIIDIQDPTIIGGCIIEIDGVKQFDSSCRLELSNLICKIKDRLGKRN
jgi:F0F1-type ATP synthase delta subunit